MNLTLGNSRFGLFIQDVLPAFFIALVVSVGLVLVVSFGFESMPDLRGNVLLEALIIAPLLAILYAGTWSKRALVPSAIFCVVYCVVVIVAFCTLLSPDVELFTDGTLNDVAENSLPFALVLVIVPVLVFLLSRKIVGCGVLFMASALACACVQFLFRDWSSSPLNVAISLVVIVFSGVLFIYQRYRQSLSSATRTGKTSFWQVAAAASVVSAACVSLGLLVFVLLIQPLNIQTPEIKPFTHYFTRPVIEYSGVYDEQSISDPDTNTSNLNDNMEDTQDDAEGGSVPDEGQDDGGFNVSTLFKSVTSFDITDWTQQFSAISYKTIALGILGIILLIAIIIAAIAWWQHRRWLARLKRWERHPKPERIRRAYQFMEERLNKLGIVRPLSLTPLEYAVSAQSELAAFARNTDGIDWLAVTIIYQRACFDIGRTDDSDWDAVRRFYIEFPKNSRGVAGSRRFKWRKSDRRR